MSTTVQKVDIRENFSDESEKTINELINVLLNFAYTCKSMACYFDRDEVALVGMVTLNRFAAVVGGKWAKELMRYQVTRGGQVHLKQIEEPEKMDWGTPVDSMTYLLEKKKKLKEFLEKCIARARDNKDQHLKNYLKNEFLEPLIYIIYKSGLLITNCKRAGTGLGEYEFSKDVHLHFPEIVDAHLI